MKIQGSYLLPCSVERAWEGLNDPEILKASLKGCETLERIDDHSFRGVVAARVGPISARFSGTMVQSEIDAPRSCRMTFEGNGGVAGFAKGEALVTLAPEDAGTRLSYDASAQVGGKLAQLGARLIDGTVRGMADDFFARFSAAMTPATGPEIVQAETPGPHGREWPWRKLALGLAVIMLVAIILAEFF